MGKILRNTGKLEMYSQEDESLRYVKEVAEIYTEIQLDLESKLKDLEYIFKGLTELRMKYWKEQK